MRKKFKDNLPFLRFIKSNSIADIKSELLNIIFFLEGDIEEINEAIKFAEENSQFQFQENTVVVEKHYDDLKKQLAQEQILARINFSRERYFKIVDLYGQVYGMKNNKEKSSNLVSPIKVEDKRLIYGALAVVIVVSVYLILKD